MPVLPRGDQQIDPFQISIDDRARLHKGNIDALADSISRYGQLHPVTVTRDFQLVAGERRVLACRQLKRLVAYNFLDELDEHERRAVELEENVNRLNMTWVEEAVAVYRYHNCRIEQDPDWDLEMTSDSLGHSEEWARRRISVMRESEKDPEILKCEALSTAYNLLQRKRQRATDLEIQAMLGSGSPPPLLVDESAVSKEDLNDLQLGGIIRVAKTEAVQTLPAQDEITQGDFRFWAPDYDGPLFNVGHFDFPYGIDHQESDQGGSAHWEGYEDSEDTFWDLCHALKAAILKGNLFIPNSHFIFWYSMNYYQDIIEYFDPLKEHLTINPHPLIWHKSDGSGILPDPKRGPRRTYETALFMTLGQRDVVKPVANSFAFPGSKRKAKHQSEKPAEVVHHFMRLCVDEYARVLDPTCGAGSALVAAHRLGAQYIRGMDLSPDNAEISQQALNLAKVEQ